MSIGLLTSTICFIACHGGPADHFSTFAEDLVKRGYTVHIYASGPALNKFQRGLATPFSLEKGAEEETAIKIAKACDGAAVVITDVGHVFDITMQKALQDFASKTVRIAYYDNPEPFVPGGYSEVAAKVMQASHKVLFANANLEKTPVHQAPCEEVLLDPEMRVGIGYYPIHHAEKIEKRRELEHAVIREKVLLKHSLEDQGQKILVYAGGNNDEYFSKAFPAFLQYLGEALEESDLSNYVILLQQHPGAKEKNIDMNLALQWKEQCGNKEKAPRFIISDFSTDDAQVAADGILYYQTSMGPQFVLAGIPTIQVGHKPYEDILVKNGLCSVVLDAKGLLASFARLHIKTEFNHAAIKQDLGIHPDPFDRFENAIKPK